MTAPDHMSAIRARLDAFSPETDHRPRLLAWYAATIASADRDLMATALAKAHQHDISRDQLYEIVLQSYLFLGFPRMLQAAEILNEHFPAERPTSQFKQISPDESYDWFSRGERLCRKVYGETYEPLKRRVESFAPEIFRWMIVEGYGKVLSRPVLSSVERELAIVGFLIADNRPPQLHSHMRGALNVGAAPSLLRQLVEDLGDAFDGGYTAALEICERLELD